MDVGGDGTIGGPFAAVHVLDVGRRDGASRRDINAVHVCEVIQRDIRTGLDRRGGDFVARQGDVVGSREGAVARDGRSRRVDGAVLRQHAGRVDGVFSRRVDIAVFSDEDVACEVGGGNRQTIAGRNSRTVDFACRRNVDVASFGGLGKDDGVDDLFDCFDCHGTVNGDQIAVDDVIGAGDGDVAISCDTCGIDFNRFEDRVAGEVADDTVEVGIRRRNGGGAVARRRDGGIDDVHTILSSKRQVTASCELGVDDGRRDGGHVDIFRRRHEIAAGAGGDFAVVIGEGDAAVGGRDADVTDRRRQDGGAVRDGRASQIDVAVSGNGRVDRKLDFRVHGDTAAECLHSAVDAEVFGGFDGDVASQGGHEAEVNVVAADQNTAASSCVGGRHDITLRAERDVIIGDGITGLCIECDVGDGVSRQAADGDVAVHVDVVGLQRQVVRATDHVFVISAKDDVAFLGEDVNIALQRRGAVHGHAVRVDVAVQLGVALDDELLGLAFGADRHVGQADGLGRQRRFAVLRQDGRQRADEVDLLRARHVAAERQLVRDDLDLGALRRGGHVALEEDLVAGHADRVVRRVGRLVRIHLRRRHGLLEQGLRNRRHVDEARRHVAAELRDIRADVEVQATRLLDVVGEADRVVRRRRQRAVAGHLADELDVVLVGRDRRVPFDDDLVARERDAARYDGLVADRDVAVGHDLQRARRAAGQHVHVVRLGDVGDAPHAVDGEVRDCRLERRVLSGVDDEGVRGYNTVDVADRGQLHRAISRHVERRQRAVDVADRHVVAVQNLDGRGVRRDGAVAAHRHALAGVALVDRHPVSCHQAAVHRGGIDRDRRLLDAGRVVRRQHRAVDVRRGHDDLPRGGDRAVHETRRAHFRQAVAVAKSAVGEILRARHRHRRVLDRARRGQPDVLRRVERAGAHVVQAGAPDHAADGGRAHVVQVSGRIERLGPPAVGLRDAAQRLVVRKRRAPLVEEHVATGPQVGPVDAAVSVQVTLHVRSQVRDALGHHDQVAVGVAQRRDGQVRDAPAAQHPCVLAVARGEPRRIVAAQQHVRLAHAARVHDDVAAGRDGHALDHAVRLVRPLALLRKHDLGRAVLHQDVAVREARHLRRPRLVVDTERAVLGYERGARDGLGAQDLDRIVRRLEALALRDDRHVLDRAARLERRVRRGRQRRVGDDAVGLNGRVFRRADGLRAVDAAGGVQFGVFVRVRRRVDDVVPVLGRDDDMVLLGLRVDAGDVLARRRQLDIALFADVRAGRDALGVDDDVADRRDRDVVKLAFRGVHRHVGLAVLRHGDRADHGADRGRQFDVALLGDVLAADDPRALRVDGLLAFREVFARGRDGQAVQLAVDAFDIDRILRGQVAGRDRVVGRHVDVGGGHVEGRDRRALGKSRDGGVFAGRDDGGDDNVSRVKFDILASFELGVDDGCRDGLGLDVLGGRHEVAARSGRDGAVFIREVDGTIRSGGDNIAGRRRDDGIGGRNIGTREGDTAVSRDFFFNGEIAIRIQRDVAALRRDLAIGRQFSIGLDRDVARDGLRLAQFHGVAADEDVAAGVCVGGHRDVARRADRDVAVRVQGRVLRRERDIAVRVDCEAADGHVAVDRHVVGLQNQVVVAADNVGVLGDGACDFLAERDVAVFGEDLDVALQRRGAVHGHAVRVDVAVQLGVALDDEHGIAFGVNRHVGQADGFGRQRRVTVLRQDGCQRADEVDFLRARHVAAERQLVGHDLDLGAVRRGGHVVLQEDLSAIDADRVVRDSCRVGLGGRQRRFELGLRDRRNVDKADFDRAVELGHVAANRKIQTVVLLHIAHEADRIVGRRRQRAVTDHVADEGDIVLGGGDLRGTVHDDGISRQDGVAGDDVGVCQRDGVGHDVEISGRGSAQEVEITVVDDGGLFHDAVDGQIGDRRIERGVLRAVDDERVSRDDAFHVADRSQFDSAFGGDVEGGVFAVYILDVDVGTVCDIHDGGVGLDIGDLANGDAFGDVGAFGQLTSEGGVLLGQIDGSGGDDAIVESCGVDIRRVGGGDAEAVAGEDAAEDGDVLAVDDERVAGGNFVAVDDTVVDFNIALRVDDHVLRGVHRGAVEGEGVVGLCVEILDFDEAVHRDIFASDRQVMGAHHVVLLVVVADDDVAADA